MHYTLIGGGGAVGQELVPVLKRSGHKVRVVGRDVNKLKDLFGDEIECELLDLRDQSHWQVLRNTDVVVYLIGVPYDRFDLHPKLTRLALEAAIAANVRYFVHVSTVYPYGIPQTRPVAETHPRNPVTFKGQMRKEQEDLVLSAHRADGMQCLIVRAPDFYGPTAKNSFVREVFEGALGNRRAMVIAPVDTPHDFIYIPDLARAIALISVRPCNFGTAYNVTGPEPITTQKFADEVYRQEGLPTKLTKAGKVLLWLYGWWNPVVGEVVEMHYLWTTPLLLDDSKFRALLPGFAKTPHSEAIKQTLQRMRKENDGRD